jgi:hypothetical protein
VRDYRYAFQTKLLTKALEVFYVIAHRYKGIRTWVRTAFFVDLVWGAKRSTLIVEHQVILRGKRCDCVNEVTMLASEASMKHNDRRAVSKFGDVK